MTDRPLPKIRPDDTCQGPSEFAADPGPLVRGKDQPRIKKGFWNKPWSQAVNQVQDQCLAKNKQTRETALKVMRNYNFFTYLRNSRSPSL